MFCLSNIGNSAWWELHVFFWAFEFCREIQVIKLRGDRIQRRIKHNVFFTFFKIFHKNLIIFDWPLLIKLTNIPVDCYKLQITLPHRHPGTKKQSSFASFPMTRLAKHLTALKLLGLNINFPMYFKIYRRVPRMHLIKIMIKKKKKAKKTTAEKHQKPKKSRPK